MNTAILQAEQFGIGTILLRLCLALLCGGIIGLERAKKHQSAGFRTYMLVCLGSTLTMLLGQYEYYLTHIAGSGSADVSRLGAQVINGIGFIATGTILVTDRQEVKGLTTAAALWASACMGLALGIGFYEGAIIGCVFIFGGMTILHRIDDYMLSKSKIVELYIELEAIQNINEVVTLLRENQIETTYIEITKSENNSTREAGVFLTVKQHQKKVHAELISMISGLPVVKYVEEV